MILSCYVIYMIIARFKLSFFVNKFVQLHPVREYVDSNSNPIPLTFVVVAAEDSQII